MPAFPTFRPGQPVRGAAGSSFPGLTEAWFICMDRPESTIPRGIGCTILRRHVFRVAWKNFPAGSVVGEPSTMMTPDLEPVPGREEPEREALDLLRGEVLRAHMLLIERKGPRAPSAWTQVPESWYLDLDAAIPAANAERTRLFGVLLWGQPDGEEIVPRICGQSA